MTRLIYLGLAAVLLAACVPNKKMVYLQKEDLKNRNEIPKDTVLRTHTLSLTEYRIQPLDNLLINFETLAQEDDAFDFLSKLSPQTRGGGGMQGGIGGGVGLYNGILVNTDGEIEYAVLGKIKLAGLTLFAAEDKIQQIAAQYVPDVIVRVRMLNFRYTVLGEVNGEKTVVSSNTRLSMMEAIGQAGGLTELADRTHIKVVRQTGNVSKVFYVNLLEEDFLDSPYFFVQQNDIIIVPPLRQRPFRTYFTSNLGIITSAISFVLFIATLSNR